MTNESKVVRYEWDDLGGVHSAHPDGEWITHADYKALEERRESALAYAQAGHKAAANAVEEIISLREERDKFKALWEQTEACLLNSMEELASLRERVGELVAADMAFDEARKSDGPGREGGVRTTNDRRRLALEALK